MEFVILYLIFEFLVFSYLALIFFYFFQFFTIRRITSFMQGQVQLYNILFYKTIKQKSTIAPILVKTCMKVFICFFVFLVNLNIFCTADKSYPAECIFSNYQIKDNYPYLLELFSYKNTLNTYCTLFFIQINAKIHYIFQYNL